MNTGLLLHQARRWVLYGILPAIVVGLGGFLYTAREPKQYETSTMMYVQQPGSDTTVPGSTDVYTSQAMIPTYSQMISARSWPRPWIWRWPRNIPAIESRPTA